jgi:ATP-dependent Clp protease ATP-binding subunit ClpA
MTSNLGARDNENNTIGFGELEKDGEDDKALKKFFPPEFRNRLDGVIKFAKLSKGIVNQIVGKFIKELNDQLKDKNIEIILDKTATEWLAKNGYDSKMGARPLGRLIDNAIKSPLSREVLFGALVDGGYVDVTLEDDKLKFGFREKTKPLTKEQRKALKRNLPVKQAQNEEQQTDQA